MDKTIAEKMYTIDHITHNVAHKFGISRETGGIRVWHVGALDAVDFFEPQLSEADCDTFDLCVEASPIEYAIECNTSAIEDT